MTAALALISMFQSGTPHVRLPGAGPFLAAASISYTPGAPRIYEKPSRENTSQYEVFVC
jgi:hypothetical protein